MDDSQIFITGASGQLGTALRVKYPKAKYADIDELDITSRQSVQDFDWTGIKVLINAAAFTNVDGAETDEGRVVAWKVNAVAVSHLTEISKKYNMTLVHISTDYVFDGTKDNHAEDEPLSPLNVYGASKAAGDVTLSTYQNHYLLRTSWVIGDGKNFVRTMIGLGQKGIAPTVVADQIGRPTFTSELVRAIDHLLKSGSDNGTYNVSNGGDPVGWADLARAIFELSELDLEVTDTSTKEYYSGKEGIAARPLKSCFDLSKLESTGFEPTDWRKDLKAYIKKELGK